VAVSERPDVTTAHFDVVQEGSCSFWLRLGLLFVTCRLLLQFSDCGLGGNHLRRQHDKLCKTFLGLDVIRSLCGHSQQIATIRGMPLLQNLATDEPALRIGIFWSRRIAITTPSVMAALRHLRRDQARPFDFALSPVLVNLTGSQVTLLAPFEKDASRWMAMPHINIHDGTTHTLEKAELPLLVQTFEMVFQQYHRHPESKSFAPDGTLCAADSKGLLKRYPVTATGFHLIGKETERGWEQNDDISTLMPSLMRYGSDTGVADEQLRKRLVEIPLACLEFETGSSRHTIVGVRRGEPVHPRSLRLLKDALRKAKHHSSRGIAM
jgi:hypothetical protein